ncbi:aminotransferase class III-fold pyridoxal phosphate-dependent enzyme [Cytobacillus praedii]|nr:aminotransferase class III-fold pyridoxal phosphate-dependent enzyme [Cytobacillus praedii]MED3553925.1 aminotransferase class III-fold pyridoxal phosphate-dependent enzyme [Cytobacillus praedii]
MIILIIDEVQTGMGHTGSLFAYKHYGIEPDHHACQRTSQRVSNRRDDG